MNEPHDNRLPSEEVEKAAAEWLVKHDRGFTPQQQDEFFQWLAASAEHRESFQRHRQMWSGLNVLAEWRPEHSTVPNPDLLARPRRHGIVRWLAPAALMAAAAAIAIGGFSFWRSPEPGPIANAATAAAEPLAFEATSYRSETLPDGSSVELNRGAHVVVQFSPRERRVLLVQGEAQFIVAKNIVRPFVVRAGGVDVRAVGTAFNVKLAGSNLEVLVTEGVVRVSQPAAPSAEPNAKSATHAMSDANMPAAAPVAITAELSAGHRTVIPVAQPLVTPVVSLATPAEIERLLEWQPRLLDFDSTPLAAVVDAFNRRNAVRLVIADEELRGLPIVASIRSDNVAGFVRLLEGTMGVRAERVSASEIVLRRAR